LQHVSDVWKYGRHPISDGEEKKKKKKTKKPQGKNIMSASATQGGHKMSVLSLRDHESDVRKTNVSPSLPYKMAEKQLAMA